MDRQIGNLSKRVVQTSLVRSPRCTRRVRTPINYVTSLRETNSYHPKHQIAEIKINSNLRSVIRRMTRLHRQALKTGNWSNFRQAQKRVTFEGQTNSHLQKGGPEIWQHQEDHWCDMWKVVDRGLNQPSPIIWDIFLQSDIDKLERIQRKAARSIKRDYRTRTPGFTYAQW